jgi:hypothetical protein
VIEFWSCLIPFSPDYSVFSFAVNNLKVGMLMIMNLPVVLYGCETWSLILRNEHRLRVSGIVEFVHHLELLISENAMFRKLDLFPSSGEWKERPTLLDPLEGATNICNIYLARRGLK